jgi:glycosyltransferase involved in cell wall biosynthesis
VRIVHVLTVPFSFRLLKGQASYLHARGYDVHAISSPGRLADEYESAEPVTVHRVPMTRAITPIADVLALVRLVRILRRLRPTVVQAGTPKGGLLGILAAWLVGVPVRIYHVRGLPLTTAAGLRRRLLRLTERIACAAATRVLCVSRSMREVIVSERICEPGRVEVLLDGSSNGVDSNRFDSEKAAEWRQAARQRLHIPPDAIVIGFVGRLALEKGLVELVEAWMQLRMVKPNAHLLLIGPFENEDPVPSHVRQALESDSRIHLTGTDWDTPSLYAAMDVLCLPSHREGFPNVLLEAAAMQLPVVASDVPGVVDALQDGRTGTLVPVRDAAALTAALACYAGEPGLRASHGARGRAWVLERFTQERIWAALDQYYRSLPEEPRQVLHVVTVPMTLEFMAGQAAFMRERNVSLSFVSSAGREQQAFAEREKVHVHSVEMSRRITPLRDLVSIVRLLRVIRRTRPSIVHAHTPKAGLVAMVASRLGGVPVRIYQLHGLAYETATGFGRWLQMTAERLACTLATRVLSVSESVRDRVAVDGVCDRRKVAVIANGSIGGIDAEQVFNPDRMPAAGERLRASLGIPASALVVGFVGRLARDKGIETLWQAWLRLRTELPSAHLLIVGPADFARRDQSVPGDVMSGFEHDPRAHVVGAIPREGLPQYYAAMDVLCLPTYREGFPVTILEAGAMGLPCVATRVTGCIDAVVAGTTGQLVTPGDAEALCSALLDYANDASLRSSHGTAARARVRARFNPHQVWLALQREYAVLAGWQAA